MFNLLILKRGRVYRTSGTSSIASWLIYAKRNKAALPYRTWCQLPKHPWAITSFRRTRIHSPRSARTLLKNVWHGRLHALVQEWTNMSCATNSHRQTLSEADRLPLIFLGAASRIDEAGFSRCPFYLSYTPLLFCLYFEL